MADIQILHFLIDLLLKQIQRAFEHHSLLLKAQYLAISGDKLIINLLDEQSKGPPVFLLNIGTSLIVFFFPAAGSSSPSPRAASSNRPSHSSPQ
jgi:hypothetical protein